MLAVTVTMEHERPSQSLLSSALLQGRPVGSPAWCLCVWRCSSDSSREHRPSDRCTAGETRSHTTIINPWGLVCDIKQCDSVTVWPLPLSLLLNNTMILCSLTLSSLYTRHRKLPTSGKSASRSLRWINWAAIWHAYEFVSGCLFPPWVCLWRVAHRYGGWEMIEWLNGCGSTQDSIS